MKLACTKWTCLAVGLVVLGSLSVASNAQENHRKERVIFLGDSITQAGAGKNGYISIPHGNIQGKLIVKLMSKSLSTF